MTLYDGPGFGEPLWRWYRWQEVKMNVAPLGWVPVTIEYVALARGSERPRISEVKAIQVDARPECARGRAAPDRCRDAPSQALEGAFGAAAHAFETIYGKGRVNAELEEGARAVEWQRDGFEISLTLLRTNAQGSSSEADDRWAIGLEVTTENAL